MSKSVRYPYSKSLNLDAWPFYRHTLCKQKKKQTITICRYKRYDSILIAFQIMRHHLFLFSLCDFKHKEPQLTSWNHHQRSRINAMRRSAAVAADDYQFLLFLLFFLSNVMSVWTMVCWFTCLEIRCGGWLIGAFTCKKRCAHACL